MLLVAGGGGEGNNGIPNKLTVLRVNFEKKKVIKRFREITLDPNDDSPTTLDAANSLILMGCNENSEKIKSGGGNQSLRKFVYENEHLRFVASIDFDGSVSPEDYTKLIYMSRDGSVGAIASSKVPTVVRIIDPRTLEEKYEIETGHDVKDMHFAPDGKVIGYITASTLEIISIVTGRFIIRKSDFDKNYILSKVRFLTDDVVLIAASLQKGTGVVLIKISLKSGSATVLKTKLVTNKFKGLTAMDVDAKNQLACIAGNDNSIALVKLKDLSLGRLFKQVHSFAITRVAFSPDSKLIASVSAANTINVMGVPNNFALSSSLGSKIWKFFVNFILIIFIAFLGQLSYRYNLHDRSYKFLKHQYLARRNGSNGKADILKQTTLVGDIVSEMTTTRPFDTANTVVETFAFNDRDTIVSHTTSSSSDDAWLSESWVSTTSISQPHTSRTQTSSTSDSVPEPVADSTTNEPRQSPKKSASSKSELTERTTQTSSKENAKVTDTGSKVLSEKSRVLHDETKAISEDNESGYDTASNTPVYLSSNTETTSETLEETSRTSTNSGTIDIPEQVSASSVIDDSSSLSVTKVATEAKKSALSKRQVQHSSVVESQVDVPQARVVDETTVNASGTTVATSTQNERPVEAATSQAQSTIESKSKTSHTMPEFSFVSTATTSSKSIPEVSESSQTQQRVQTTKAEAEIPVVGYEKSDAHTSSEIEREPTAEALEPSGAEIDYDSIDEKTPEPTEVLSADQGITTPTDTLVSIQDSSDNEDEVFPSDEETLETGKSDEHSRTRHDTMHDTQSSNDVIGGSQSKEIEVHVEVPTRQSSTLSAATASSQTDHATAQTTTSPEAKPSVAVQHSSSDGEAADESLENIASTEHADEPESPIQTTAELDTSLDGINDPVESTSIKSASKSEVETVTSAEPVESTSINSMSEAEIVNSAEPVESTSIISASMSEVETVTSAEPSLEQVAAFESSKSLEQSTVPTHSEIEATEETSTAAAVEESSSLSTAESTVVYDEL